MGGLQGELELWFVQEQTMTARMIWADHDAEFTSIGRRYLSAQGFDVTIVPDALACLDELHREPADVLILDEELQWGGIDGVLERLRSEAGADMMPLVFASGDDRPQVLAERFNLPPARCLQKPYRLQSIVAAVEQQSPSRRNAIVSQRSPVLEQPVLTEV